MLASRYQGSFGYAPRMASGSYPGGGPRNALAPVYSAPPVGSVGAPVGMPQAPAMQAPMAPAAPSLTSGTGALSGPPRMSSDGAGDSAQGEYGGPGPTGEPSTGNFGEDAKNAAQNLGGFLGLAAMGPPGIAIGAISGLAAGALRGLGYEETANALVSGVFGGPSVGGPSVVSGWGNPGSGQTPEGGNFGAGANVTGGNFADPSMTSTPDISGSFTGPTGPTSMDGMTGNPDGALGNPGDFGTPAGGNFGDGANSSGGEGMNSGGESNTSDGTAGVGSSGTWRYGGYTGHGDNGEIDPDAEAGTVHEGEYVLRHEATQHYGADIMHALNAGQIPRNVLAALTMQQRPQAANHLLQMMMR